jgi:hypothetical protein
MHIYVYKRTGVGGGHRIVAKVLPDDSKKPDEIAKILDQKWAHLHAHHAIIEVFDFDILFRGHELVNHLERVRHQLVDDEVCVNLLDAVASELADRMYKYAFQDGLRGR